LKQKCDEPLSNVAFNFNVRRYTVLQSASPPFPGNAVRGPLGTTGGPVQVDRITTRVESAQGFSA
jgi:hypothetical protein